MHDGRLDTATVAEMLKALGDDDQALVFATGDKAGKGTQPVIRFISPAGESAKKGKRR
jgi:hypothetical protein